MLHLQVSLAGLGLNTNLGVQFCSLQEANSSQAWRENCGEIECLGQEFPHGVFPMRGWFLVLGHFISHYITLDLSRTAKCCWGPTPRARSVSQWRTSHSVSTAARRGNPDHSQVSTSLSTFYRSRTSPYPDTNNQWNIFQF